MKEAMTKEGNRLFMLTLQTFLRLKLVMVLQPFHNHGPIVVAAAEAFEEERNE